MQSPERKKLAHKILITITAYQNMWEIVSPACNNNLDNWALQAAVEVYFIKRERKNGNIICQVKIEMRKAAGNSFVRSWEVLKNFRDGERSSKIKKICTTINNENKITEVNYDWNFFLSRFSSFAGQLAGKQLNSNQKIFSYEWKYRNIN